MAGPARPASERDLVLVTNGSPIFLGALVSTGAAVNNLTTANPFNSAALNPAVTPAVPGFAPNFTNTLAGKTLLLQSTAAGLILPSTGPSMVPVANVTLVIALQSVLPPVAGTAPGVALVSGERVELIMLPNEGWLQWLPLVSGNLLVWELR